MKPKVRIFFNPVRFDLRADLICAPSAGDRLVVQHTQSGHKVTEVLVSITSIRRSQPSHSVDRLSFDEWKYRESQA